MSFLYPYVLLALALPLLLAALGFVAHHRRNRDWRKLVSAEHEAELHPDVQTATTDQILPLVRYGLGLGFVPEDFAREALAKQEVIQLELADPPPQRYISLVKDKTRPLSVAAIEMERMLREASG